MKYFLIALLAIGIGFGATKLTIPDTITNLRKSISGIQDKISTPPAPPPIENTPPPVQTEPEAIPPAQTGPSVKNEQVTVSFIGSKGTTTYAGYFQKVSANLKVLMGVVVGTVAVDTASLITPIPEATANWKSVAHFDSPNNPVMSFTFSTWKKETENTYTATGKLVVKGKEKIVTMLLTFENGQYSGEISVKATDIGFGTKLITDLKIFVKVPVQ